MGTNYYVYKQPIISDEEYTKLEILAKNHDITGIINWNNKNNIKLEKIHLGKSSCGWQFCFNHNNWEYYDYSKDSILTFLKSCTHISDEYGSVITITEFWNMIDKKRSGFTGKTYCNHVLQQAIDKDNGKLEDKFDLIPTVSEAFNRKYIAEKYNWYEEHHYGQQQIPADLGYVFNSSTEFS